MNKKVLMAGLAPLMAVPLVLAPATTASATHEENDLRCNIRARAISDDEIRVAVSVRGDRDDNRRHRLFVRLTDNRRTVAQETIRTRLPFRESGEIRNRRGPDVLRFTAVDLRTGERCSDTTVVTRREPVRR